jgi:preprotein translocase subunit SecG
MSILLTIIHCFVGLFLIVVVLLQSGRAGGMGAGFGGSSTGVFGARGANTFLTKVTAGCAITFFLTSITLSVLSSKTGSVVADHANQEAVKPTEPGTLEGKTDEAAKPETGKAAETQDTKPAPAATTPPTPAETPPKK